MTERLPGTKRSGEKRQLELERNVTVLLTWLANKLARGASVEYRRMFGVGITEWRVLALLAIEREVTANRIVEVIGLNKGATSRCLSGLEARGLTTVRPSAVDGRAKLNRLTKAGQRLHDAILPIAHDRERRLLQRLTPEDIERLIATLVTLHESLPDVNRFPEEGPDAE